ncbi:hypothetical protein UFOVP229_24 [uncultured Caudovirales phage]|uniref:Uncharacterized protein n=1 Tax=uncultured Caudovirales phage TaxID=2100421 RepID=A0A6J7WML7_9CAUD|nr:hypothetical protein UFOVP229_24 [uncultured Caudovirales phage]
MSTLDICMLLNQARVAVNKSLRKLRDRNEVFISFYERQPEGRTGAFVPHYNLGKHQDAKKPTPISKAERDKAYRRRHKARISAKRYPHHVSALGVWSGLGGR